MVMRVLSGNYFESYRDNGTNRIGQISIIQFYEDSTTCGSLWLSSLAVRVNHHFDIQYRNMLVMLIVGYETKNDMSETGWTIDRMAAF